jgi:hypothetical protein
VKEVVMGHNRTGKRQMSCFRLRKDKDIVEFNLIVHGLRGNQDYEFSKRLSKAKGIDVS